ncbi:MULTISPECIES: heavy-metal-associated domain-containing protein [Halobacteriales]|uniref:Heavy-metal-associated domain-containing protein n=1 Tax=Halorussus aquaticus TaxID=2953748 RepID=A0ABD5Q7U9_9EURY|nr:MULTISPECIES: heavy-metal-associated domain-containing protein [Halobacteriales]USZ78523.1 heavy-metal-associated domain-containing protein [Halorussus vallis]
MERKTIAVTGMSCNGCEQNVENALKTIEGVTRVEADHKGDSVEIVVDENTADDDLNTAIRDAGYDVTA